MKTKRKVLLRANKMLSNCKSESNCLTLRFTIVLNCTLAYLCKELKMKRQILLGLSVLMIVGALMPTITNAEKRVELTIDPDGNVMRRATQSADTEAKTLALKNKEAVLRQEDDSWTDYDLWSHLPKDQDAINKIRKNPRQPYMCERLEKEAQDKFARGRYFYLLDSAQVQEKYFDRNSARVGSCECEFYMGKGTHEHPKVYCKVPIYYKSLIYKGK